MLILPTMDSITIQTDIAAQPEKVWKLYTSPQHVMKWNFASDDWHCPAAENDLRPGGQLCYEMAARDGSSSFLFLGNFTLVDKNKRLIYILDDGRKVDVIFENTGESTRVFVTFDPHPSQPAEVQQAGWMAILENFRKYVVSDS
jgi:uncharacterized protein YndB with AHSA1/START domain